MTEENNWLERMLVRDRGSPFRRSPSERMTQYLIEIQENDSEAYRFRDPAMKQLEAESIRQRHSLVGNLPENYPTKIDFSQVKIFPDDNNPSQYYQNYWEGMKDVVGQGHIALNFPDTLRWKLWMHDQGKTEKAFNYWYETCSGVLYKKDSDLIKIVHNMKELYSLVNKPTLTDGALDIPDDVYDSYQVNEYSKSKVVHDQHQNLAKTIEDPLWLELCGGDEELLNLYAGNVYHLLKPRKQTKFMRVWLGNNHKNKNLGRSWYVINLDYRSVVSGYYPLGYNGRFLSVAQMESERSEE